MNKRKVLDVIKRYFKDSQDVLNRMIADKSGLFQGKTSDYYLGERNAYRKALRHIERLDDPHPPVEVEPCVADWLDDVYCVDDSQKNMVLFDFLYRYSKKIMLDSDIDKWFNKSSEGIFILSDALRYGYVRKEEPKYLLPVPYLENMYYAMYDDGKIGYANSPKELSRGKNQFTEEEIKEHFPDMENKKIPVDES